jgi:DNA-binding transcriptional LysR family regulator
VSATVADLERLLGVQLLVRHRGRGVAPSPAGRQLLAGARGLLDQARGLERLAADLGAGVAGPLDLGCLLSLAPLVAPAVCRAFEERYPGAHVTLVEGGQDELLDGLARGRLSAVLTYDLELDERVAFHELAVLPPYAQLAAGDELAGAPEVELAELAERPYVLLDLPQSREYFQELFRTAGLVPRIAHRSRHLEVVRSMVANGYGYTLANARAAVDVAVDGSPLVSVPLAGEHRPMRLGVATLRSEREPRIVAAFREHCAEALEVSRLAAATAR